ncbi:solute carrier family 22 member 1 [Bombyx mandarina]|uniref:Solute carrier family 22 member 1 n=1 Tax=Bombyx mandarina TaxID=7092 RepID=A0A6J2KC97_BOMMA|nr:solute carrier family 22 member 1 [Bombyx mandarina]
METPSLYHRALSEVTKTEKYQKKYDYLYNVALACLWSMAFNNIILALTIIPYTCEIPDAPKNVNREDWKEMWVPKNQLGGNMTIFSNCLIYDENNNITDCQRYRYDNTWYKSTIPSENNWVCEKEYYVINILSHNKISETVGSLIFGWFGDAYGRRLTYMISLLLLVIGRTISIIFSHSVVIFSIGCLIAAFPATSALQCTSSISMEISSPKRRSSIAKLRFIASSVGLCLMPLLYWWIREWKLFMITTTVTQLPYLLWSWKMIESPQWLWINQRNKECENILEQIAKDNRTALSSQTKQLISASHEEHTEKQFGFLLLFSNKELALVTILQLFIWVSVTLSYTVSFLSSGESSQTNPFLDFAFQSLAEIPGHFSGAWLADNIGRRYTCVVSFGVSSVAWVIIGFKDFVMWPDVEWIWIFVQVLNRYSITISYYIINLLNMEIYPTAMRQSGMALGNLISGIAAAIAPYVLLLGHKHGSFWSSAILSLFSIIGLMSGLGLPETVARRRHPI